MPMLQALPAALARALTRLGAAGAPAPAAAALAGLAVPPLAALGHALLAPAAVLLLSMTVALAEPGRLTLRELGAPLALALATLLVSPLVALGLVEVLGLGAGGAWLVLVAACPTAGSAALMARLLGLPLRPVLLGQLLAFAAMPLTAPLIAAAFPGSLAVAPGTLFLRVGVMVLAPALLGLALRGVLGPVRRKAAEPTLRGLGVLALAVIGLALGDGLWALAAAARDLPVLAAGVLLASLIGGAVGGAAGALAGGGLLAAFALGGAVRNVSLLWSAMSGAAAEEGELVMRLALLWTLTLPALLTLAARRRPVAAAAAAARPLR